MAATPLPPPPPAAEPPEPAPAGWEDILAPGERILWQGRPDATLDWRAFLAFESLFGLLFAGFAVFWMAMILGATPSVPTAIFSLFGLPFLFIGLRIAAKPALDARQRRQTYYTLTDRTAFIATAFGGRRKLQEYSLTADMPLRLEEGDPGTVWFAERVSSHQAIHPHKTRSGNRLIVTRRPVGFQRIAEARHVYGLMRRRMRDLTAPSAPSAPDPSP